MVDPPSRIVWFISTVNIKSFTSFWVTLDFAGVVVSLNHIGSTFTTVQTNDVLLTHRMSCKQTKSLDRGLRDVYMLFDYS